MSKKTDLKSDEANGPDAAELEHLKGQWFINNSTGRQGIRNTMGQNIVLEQGDVMYVLDSEKSVKRVMAKQSHFMNYKGSLIGRWCIYPGTDTPTVNQPARQFVTPEDFLNENVPHQMWTPRTVTEIKVYREELKSKK